MATPAPSGDWSRIFKDRSHGLGRRIVPRFTQLEVSQVFEPLPCPDHDRAKLQVTSKHAGRVEPRGPNCRKGTAMMEFLILDGFEVWDRARFVPQACPDLRRAP